MVEHKLVVGVAVLLLLIVVSGGGYYVWEGVTREPEVEVAGVDYEVVDSVSLFGVVVPTNVSVIVGVEVYNPNIISFTLQGGSYDVFVNDVKVGEGVLPEGVEVPADGIESFESEIQLDAVSGVKGLIEALGSGMLTAKVDGNAYVEVPLLGVREIRFSQERELVD